VIFVVTKAELINNAKDRQRNVSISVGTTSLLISPQLTTDLRKALVITNTSTAGQKLYLSWGEPAVVGNGIELAPGSAWSESIDSAYIPSMQDIWVVSNAAGGTAAIQERTM